MKREVFICINGILTFPSASEGWAYFEPIAAAHIFAPAADWADFKDALDLGAVERVRIYGSANDEALKIAAQSRCLLGWAGLGYGSMGLHGPEIAEQAFPHDVRDFSNDSFGHSTWFERGEHFESTMRLLCNTSGLAFSPDANSPLP